MIELKHFSPAEFHFPDEMDEEFLLFLDEVREYAKVPFFLTSDYRTPEHNQQVGGHPRSLHVKGRAVDFVTPGCRARDNQLYYEELFKITDAVMYIATDNDKVQLELVKGSSDYHVHLGLYPDGWLGPSKLIIHVD